MGNHRFKLSDMMPNAWFYKLRDMSKVRSQKKSRKSFCYYAPAPDPDSIRMHTQLCLSPHKPAKRKTVYMPSPTSPHRPHFSLSSSASASDIIIDASYNPIHLHTLTQFDTGLPPIHTKPPKHSFSRQDSFVFHNASISFPLENPKRSRKSFSGGVKLRGSGRKLSGKKPQGRRRKNAEDDGKNGKFYSESFAIVKASFDPEKDFKESMMEMIVENNITESKDLEELLACYLSLNSNQYHDLIIKAFEQIWFSMAQLQF